MSIPNGMVQELPLFPVWETITMLWGEAPKNGIEHRLGAEEEGEGEDCFSAVTNVFSYGHGEDQSSQDFPKKSHGRKL